MCNSSSLLGILSIVKRTILLIQIIVPIILMLFGIFSLIKLLKNPEEKDGTKKIINQFIAAAIVFFIPMLVNAVMNLAGSNTNFSSCWNSASDKIIISSKYIKINEKDKKPIIYNAEDYEKGLSNLDFSCTSKTVKAQFSCDTLKIVEKHLYDFDATNFHERIASYGGFDAYAKSLGGIFGEYYGKKIEGRTTRDFQIAAEYVLGWMYMYGWDYYYTDEDGGNAGGRVRWRGNDAFYANGGFVGRYISDSSTPQYRGPGTNFDNVISTKSQGGSTGRMASACGDLEFFIFNKLNINRTNQLPKVSRLKELKVGDCLFFGNSPTKWNKFDESNWYNAYGAHNVVIGEVYDDHVVIYDAGSYYPSNQNYKRELYFPKEDTEEADDAEVKKVFGYSSWGIRRWYDFEEA